MSEFESNLPFFLRGGTPPPLTLSFSGIFFPNDDVFVMNKIKNGPKRPYNRPKRPYNRPKRAKMYEQRQKMEFLDQKYLLFSGIFLSGIWGS